MNKIVKNNQNILGKRGFNDYLIDFTHNGFQTPLNLTCEVVNLQGSYPNTINNG